MKDIPGYEGLYAVTSTGRVWSHPKRWKCFGGETGHNGKWLARKLDQHGYYRVDISVDGKRKTPLVHRLVALAFIPLVEGKKICESQKRQQARQPTSESRMVYLKRKQSTRLQNRAFNNAVLVRGKAPTCQAAKR
jgi:hypothetical protein